MIERLLVAGFRPQELEDRFVELNLPWSMKPTSKVDSFSSGVAEIEEARDEIKDSAESEAESATPEGKET